MNPVNFKAANMVYRAPADWNEERDGPCGDLHVRREGSALLSVWQPSPEEIEIIMAGGSIVLSILGTAQPPVALWAENVTLMIEADDRKEGDS